MASHVIMRTTFEEKRWVLFSGHHRGQGCLRKLQFKQGVIFVDHALSGNVAQSECQGYDADLPWPENEQQNTDLKSLLNNMDDIGEVWLGITDVASEGSWAIQTRYQYGSIIGQGSKNSDGNIDWIQNGTGVAWG